MRISLFLKILAVLFFCLGTARAECLDGSEDVEKNFEHYMAEPLCLESLQNWILSSPERLAVLDEVMRKHFSQHPVKVFKLRKALEEKLADKSLSMGPETMMTYQALLEDGSKWEFANLLSGIAVGGGSYFLVRKQLKRFSKFNKRLFWFRFNPVTFLIGGVIMVGTGEGAMRVMDVTYQKYLKARIDKGVESLSPQKSKEEKAEILRSIVEDAMNLVAIEERKFFIIFMGGLQRIESIGDAKEFFGNLIQDYPQFLDASMDENRIVLLLSELEGRGVTGTEEELQPLIKYLVLQDTIIKLFRWYGDS